MTNCIEVLESLPLIFGQYIFDFGYHSSNISVIIEEENDLYIVSTIGKRRIFKRIDYLFVFLGKFLHVIETEKSWLLLHGFVVGNSRTNEAVALVGASRSGKSTLGSYLINNNFDFVSDDIVVVNIDNLMLIPFGRPIHLRPQGIGALCDSNLIIDIHTQRVITQRYLYHYPVDENRKYILKNIYFVHYGRPCMVCQIQKDQAIQLLAESVFSISALTQSLRKCDCLREKVKLFMLEYTDMNFAREQIITTW